MQSIKDLLMTYNLPQWLAQALSILIVLVFMILTSVVCYAVAKKLLSIFFSRDTKKDDQHKWYRFLRKRKFFYRVPAMFPGIIAHLFSSAFGDAQRVIERFANAYLLIFGMLALYSFLDALDDYYRSFEISKIRPIKGMIQVFKIVFFIIIAILSIALLLDQSPVILLSGIGALTAIYTIIFKDAILGFVAGIQLSANDMLRIDDWIEMPKYGADGDVIDVTLTTVKVRNWDRTIISIPAYALISDSFKNWRGMRESGGRRIKRSIHIDMNSIRFCTNDMLEKFKKIEYIREYVEEKQREVQSYNQEHNVCEDILVNGRHLTNIGTFRAYVTQYLKRHPMTHPTLLQMVRQLPPDQYGLPIEIYLFVNDTNWVVYEAVQADIFDHLLAVVREFDLRIFQTPTGYDLTALEALRPHKEPNDAYKNSERLPDGQSSE